ncbi:GSCFA domain-containing protein [Lacinutrix venerupis]|uniref:GSCFA domain-containing protein n=1 Tax=Lacinutrix venerupis TaxID=1486034 RepID=A0AAC9LJU4_9FLAO|nr:GSCFA domain-containing protein [Lacinutrix venerupis]APX99413.1 GSCFA domain-containing protein [Lacinutrix venerupis]
MKLQTNIKLKKQEHNLIDYNSKLLLLGSCFSENIGNKLEYFKFQSISNPFGILFHPKAIETVISRALQQKKYLDSDVFYHNEQWHCFDAHSVLSNASKEDLLKDLNTQLQFLQKSILESTHIIITLGTAWVYNLVEENKIVANCHKVPQKAFKKNLLSIESIKKSLQNCITKIRAVNKTAKVIFTVSPVRHIKDGFVENMQSKSHLISAIHQVLNTETLYFPSYEIMMDELRDYRFYKDDMLHPNTTAIKYIWQKFIEVWLNLDALQIMKEVDVVQKGLQHKPFNSNSQAHKEFLLNLDIKKESLTTRFSHILF